MYDVIASVAVTGAESRVVPRVNNAAHRRAGIPQEGGSLSSRSANSSRHERSEADSSLASQQLSQHTLDRVVLEQLDSLRSKRAGAQKSIRTPVTKKEGSLTWSSSRGGPLSTGSSCFSGGFSVEAASAYGPRPAGTRSSDEQQLRKRLLKLWERTGAPSWHRELYAARYFKGGARAEVLQREAAALASGTALVQDAQKAVDAREAVLSRLRELRLRYSDDDDFRKGCGIASLDLRELLVNLRAATITVVEALCAWRHSVAPLPAERSCGETAFPRVLTCSVAGPSARGASWPFPGPKDDDYLLRVIDEDSTVHLFENVLELAAEKDPFLMYSAITRRLGKLRLPPVACTDAARIRAAEMLLCEEEVALKVFRGHRHVDMPADRAWASDYSSSPGRLENALSQLDNLSLPSLQTSARLSPSPAAAADSVAEKPLCPATGLLPSVMRRILLTVLSAWHDGATEVVPEIPQHPSRNFFRRTQILPRRMTLSVSGGTAEPHQHRRTAVAVRNVTPAPNTLQASSASPSRRASRASSVDPLSQQASSSAARPITPSSPKMVVHPPSRKNSSVMLNKANPAMLSQLHEETSSIALGRPSSRRSSATTPMPAEIDSAEDVLHHVMLAYDPLAGEASSSGGDGSDDEEEHKRILAVFSRLAYDGNVYKHEMMIAVKRLGFTSNNKAWMDEATGNITQWGTLNQEEFCESIAGYRALEQAHWWDQFQQADENNSGNIDINELSKLLRGMGVVPMKHALMEAIDDVDDNCDGMLDFGQFCDVMSLLRVRGGFTEAEVNSFWNVFCLFDCEHQGDIDVDELFRALLYLGYRATPESSREIAHEVDFDMSGTIDYNEFGWCMQKVRDREVALISKCLEAYKPNRDGMCRVALEELEHIFHRVGYFPSEDAVYEVWEEVCRSEGMDPKTNLCDLSRLYRCLLRLRANEGLSRNDLADVDAAFARYAEHPEQGAAPRSGANSSAGPEAEVKLYNIPRILRSMGYCIPFEEQQLITTRVDINETGSFDVVTLRKMVRMVRELRLRAIHENFCTHSGNTGSIRDTITETLAHEALRSLGCIQDSQAALQVKTMEIVCQGRGVDHQSFMRMARLYDDAARRSFRENDGYSQDELEILKTNFNLFDADGSGSVDNKELMSLVKTTFPSMCADPKMYKKLEEIMKESDENGNGTLDFQEYLRLVRAVSDLYARIQLLNEKRVIKQTGFSTHEVYEFRELFLAKADACGLISFDDFQQMLASVIPITVRNALTLAELWSEVGNSHLDDGEFFDTKDPVPPEEGIPSSQQPKDFADFLWLMRKILDTNFGGVIEHTQHVKVPVSEGR